MVVNKLIINNEVKSCHSLSNAIDHFKAILQSDVNLISDEQFFSAELIADQIVSNDFKSLFCELAQSPIPLQLVLRTNKAINNTAVSNHNNLLETFNAAFDALYRQKKRDNENNKIRETLKLKQKINGKVTFADLRRSKINMVNAVTSNMQLQQQQQQQQQQRKSITPAGFHKKKRVKNEYHQNFPEDTNQQSDLITRNNIIAKLGNYFKTLYPKQDEQTLLTIWDSLVGKHAEQIDIPGSVITHVDANAMKKIIAHVKDFQEGLVFEYLPEGFTIKSKNIVANQDVQTTNYKTNNVELHLYYNDTHAFSSQMHPQSSPYQLSFLKDKLMRPSYLDFVLNANQLQHSTDKIARTMYEEDAKLQSQYQQFINQINSPHKKASQSTFDASSLSFFQDAEHIGQLKVLGLERDSSFKTGLSEIILHEGVDSAALFLEQLVYLKLTYADRYNLFNKLFIKGQSDFIQFATLVGKENLNMLHQMKNNEFFWWASLASQHIDAGCEANFNSVTNAIKAFFAKIKHVKRALGEDFNFPESCSVKDVKNVITALGRMAFIIGDGELDEQNEQINEFLRQAQIPIDLHNEGAYFAKKYNGYHVVASPMLLTPQTANFGEADLPYQALPLSAFMRNANDFNVSYEELKRDFFRILGQLDERVYSIEDYSNCLAGLESAFANQTSFFSQRFSNDSTIKKKLLGVILSLMIEPRESQTFEKPNAQIDKLITHINSLHDHKQQDEIADNLLASLFKLTNTAMDSKPTVDEIIDWCKQIESKSITELNTFLSVMPNVLANYGRQTFSMIDVLQERNKSAENKNGSVPNLDLSELFKCLNNIADYKGKQENDRTQGANSGGQCKLLQFASLLPYIEDAEDENGWHVLYNQITQYDSAFLDMFCREFNTLNLTRSRTLPTYQVVSDIIELCYQQYQSNSQLSQQQIKDILTASPKLSDVVFGSQTLEESKYGVVDVIKYYFLRHDVTLGIKAIKKTLPMIQGGLAVGSLISKRADQLKQELEVISGLVPSVEEDVSKLIEQLRKETNAKTLHECLEILSRIDSHVNVIVKAAQRNGLEKEITSFMDKFVTKDTDLDSLKDKFLAKPSIIVFITADISAKFDRELKKIFSRINLSDSILDHACHEYLGKLNNEGDLITIVEDYAKKFEIVTSLTNQLIYIKNNSEADFLSIKNFINDLLIDQNTRLSVDKINELLSVLLKLRSIPLTESFALICEKIITNPALSMNIGSLLGSINIIAQLQKLLPDTDIKSLLIAVLQNQSTVIQHGNTNAPTVTLSDDTVAKLKGLLNNNAVDKIKAVPIILETCKIAMSLPDNSSIGGNDFIQAVFATLTNASTKFPQLVGFTNYLFQVGTKDTNQLASSFMFLTQTLLQDESKTALLLSIMNNVLAADGTDHGNPITLQHITQLIQTLNSYPRGQIKLEDIASLYKKRPFPTKLGYTCAETLSSLLGQPEDDLKKSLIKLDNDPFNRRVDNFVNKQFNTDRVAPVIAGIQNLIDKQSLSFEEMHKLGRQCLFINSIGKDFPPPGHDKPLMSFSRAELYDYALTLVSEIRATDMKRETLMLEFLAVLREIMHRTTGEFPYTTQLVSALHAINHGNNLLLQINTGEGKSITSALLAVMQWANGESVDVCTANMDLASRDFDHFKNFFGFLDIPANKISADGANQNYQIGGINYSTVADLSLYRSKAKLENIDLKHINGKKIKTSLILDEVDFNTLDNRTLFNYTSHANDQDNYLLHCEWIYGLINDYVDSSAFRNIDVNANPYSATLDLTALESFIKARVKDPEKLKLIAKIKDEDKSQFNRWIDAADEAKQLKYEHNYSVSVDEVTGVCIAIPKNNNNPQPGSTYRHGVQQFLHARLQKEYQGEEVKGKNYRFPIEPEQQVSASESSKTFIDYYDHEGRIIGMSGTLGTQNELLEQQYNLHAEIFCIPPHNKNIREVSYQPQNDNKHVIKAIKDKIQTTKHFAPHIDIIIDRVKENKRNVVTNTHHFTRSQIIGLNDLFIDMVEESKKHNGLLPQENYSSKLNHTLTTTLLNANNHLYKEAPDLQRLVNKILQREDLNVSDITILQSIAKNTHFKFHLFEDQSLPQPTLVITKDSIKAQDTFQALAGLSAAEWQKLRQNFHVLGDYLAEGKQHINVSYDEYGKRIPFLSVLKSAKETIFKDANYIRELIDKISTQQDLTFYELRTLKAISENNYYAIKQKDFDDFCKLVAALVNKQPTPPDIQNTVIFCIHDLFKYEPEIKQILMNLLAGNMPSVKELAVLAGAAAKPWYQFNKGSYFEYELVVGDENEAARELKTKKAGNPYTVTISTSLMGRGVDVKALHIDKTLVIQTYLDSVRNTEQIIGRCARNGEPGKYFFIYDVNENNALHQLHLKSKADKANHHEINKAQLRMDENAAVERYYVQEVDNLSNIVMREFQRLEKFMHELTYQLPHDYEYNKREEQIRSKRIYLIQTLEETWKEVLEQSDPNNKYYENPYIRRNSKGDLLFDDLDHALLRFEYKIKALWQNTRNEMMNDLIIKHMDHAEEKEFAEAKLNYLQNISIDEIITHRKQVKSFSANNTDKLPKSAEQDLRYALDQGIIYHDYTHQQPSQATLFKAQANRYKIMLDDIEKLITDAAFNASIKDKLFALRNNINFKHDVLPLADENLTDEKKQEHANLIQERLLALLLAYKKQCRQLDDKYAAQTIAYNLLKMSSAVSKPTEAQKLLAQQVKHAFLDTAVSKLTAQILKNFEWVNHKHSLQYLLERKEFCVAAKEIYDEAQKLRSDPSASNVLHLQYLLEHYRLRTHGLWSFNKINPFAHPCAKVIREALLSTHKIKFISQHNQIVPFVERPEIRTMAAYQVVQNKIDAILRNSAFRKLNQDESNAFHKIANKVRQVINQQSSAYVYQLNDLQFILNRYQNYYANDGRNYAPINTMLRKLQQVVNDKAFAELVPVTKLQETNTRLLAYRKRQILKQLLAQSPELKNAQPCIELGIKPRGGENYYEVRLTTNDAYEPAPHLGFKRSTDNNNAKLNKLNYWLTKLQSVSKQIENISADNLQMQNDITSLHNKMTQVEQDKIRYNEELRNKDKIPQVQPTQQLSSKIKGFFNAAKNYFYKNDAEAEKQTKSIATNTSLQQTNSAYSPATLQRFDEQLFDLNAQITSFTHKTSGLKEKIELLKTRKEYIETKINAFKHAGVKQQNTNTVTYIKIIPSTEAFKTLLYDLPPFDSNDVAKPSRYDKFKQRLHHLYDNLHGVGQSMWQLFHHASLPKRANEYPADPFVPQNQPTRHNHVNKIKALQYK